MNQADPPLLFEPLLLLLLFAALWLTISTLLPRVSGWTKLAQRFHATQAANGERFSVVSARMGKGFFTIRYNNCLFFTVNNAGFHMSIMFFFRFQSPPLFIPWSEVESIEEKRLFFGRYMVIHLKNQGPLISIRGRVGQAIKLAFDTASSQNSF
ncbi:MAG: hypothetical protein RL748_2136 [Pseudomonadota bacterium]|jgi:hypothetical protein